MTDEMEWVFVALVFVSTVISAAIHIDELQRFRDAFTKWSESSQKGSLVADALTALLTVGFYALLVSIPVVLVLSVVMLGLRGD